jgi:two-component system, NarL family, nitrate/nitrite response regulator NarL
MTMSAVNVILVGPNNLFRQGLRRLLDPSQFTIAEEARDLASVERLLQQGVAPDMVVADLTNCLQPEFESLHRLRELCEDIRIVVLVNELCLSNMTAVLKAGADGYLVNELSTEAFSLSLMLVMQGEKVLPGTLANVLARDPDPYEGGPLVGAPKNLTERERQILRCLLKAYSNKHIARALNISEGTVKVHLKSLMKKIAAGNRTQAALWARNNGISDGLGQLMAG